MTIANVHLVRGTGHGAVIRPVLCVVILCLSLLMASSSTALAENRYGIAVIIGNGTYEHSDVPGVTYADRDADAFRSYILDVLGYREENIIDLRNASQAEMTATFGVRGNHQGLIWQYYRGGRSDIVVFYSGHGVPGRNDGSGYLLPSDADPITAELNGYPIEVLYENLAALEARSVTVYLDACFSGGSHAGMLIRAASPIYVSANLPEGVSSAGMTVLTAASGDQLASWDEEREHGLFTGYLLDGLYGAADGEDFGNGDGRVSVSEVKAWLDEEMTYAARRNYRRVQEATVIGDPDRVLSAVPEFGWSNALTAEGSAEEQLGLDTQTAALTQDPETQEAAEAPLTPEPEPEHTAVGISLNPGTVFRDCADCPEMVVVPAGSFMMGSPPEEEGRFEVEGPVHEVRIPESFAVGVFEVTFDEWDVCVAAGVCNEVPVAIGGRGRRPVSNVRWQGAQTYVDWLSDATGASYRLLTEAEWEFVARAGTQTRYWWGDSYDSSLVADSGVLEPVGSYPANGFGLHDVYGSVWEWTNDCWNASYHGAPADGSAWRSGQCSSRVMRGGSVRELSTPEVKNRSAMRYGATTGIRGLDLNLGFRIARDISDFESSSTISHLTGTAPELSFSILETDEILFALTRSNLRSGPGTEYDPPIGQLEAGAEVRVTGRVEDMDWARIALAGGEEAFIFAPLLGEEDPVEVAAREAEAARLAEEQRILEEQRQAEELARIQVATAWDAVRQSDSVEEIEGFLSDYPDAEQAEEAQHLLEELRTSARSLVAGDVFEECSRPQETFVARAGHSTPGEYFCGPEMVVVPAGSYWMGSDYVEREKPRHEVRLDYSFAVGVYEITFQDWDACVSDGGCNGYRPNDGGWGRGRRPVINVSWDDAQAYVSWLSEKLGARYRLLSESEWEYVTRAGSETFYWWGDEAGRNNANCDGCDSRWDDTQTAPAGSFRANPFGLYDVHGNVFEWTQDCWHYGYDGAPTDGSAWTHLSCEDRIFRGGSWYNNTGWIDSSFRSGDSHDARENKVGFRVARDLD